MAFLVIATGLAAAFAAGVAVVGLRIGAVGRVALAGIAVVTATWAIGIALISTAWRDIDGFVDCNDYCHGWHYLGAFLFWTPPIAGLLLLLVLGLAAVLAARSRLNAPVPPDDARVDR